MNVTLLEEKGKNIKRLIIYILIAIMCIVAIGIAVYQFFDDEKLGVIIGISSKETASQEEIDKLKAEFDNVFTNSLKTQDNIDVNKENNDKDLVYTSYEKTETSLNNYDLNVHIPYININNETIKNYNEQIGRIFAQKAEQALQTQNQNIVYTVEYGAQISNNILSLIIRSNLKEGSNPQRVIVQTYNYDLKNNKELTVSDMLSQKGVESKVAEQKVREEIVKVQRQVEELGELGYNIFARDSKSDIYKIENTTEFFMYNNYLYLIYAYGNQNNTSEIDLVIF